MRLVVRPARCGGAGGAQRRRIREAVGDPARGAADAADSLPMIGPAPRHSGLGCTFGHQHIGFRQAATGAAIAAMIGRARRRGSTPAVSPGRYL